MIVQHIYLEFYDWHIVVFYIHDELIIEEIIDILSYIKCSYDQIDEIKESLLDNIMNIGFTITNTEDKYSVVIIGPTTSSDEFQDTYDHEKGHLATHIATSLGIDFKGEGMQYLNSAIGKAMFPVAKYFLCDKCRHKLLEEIS